jgi:hypothetical protein
MQAGRLGSILAVVLAGAIAAPASAVELNRTDYDAAPGAWDPEIAPLDGQNGPDLAIGNGTPGVQVFLNDGLGNLGVPTSMPLTCRFGATPQVELGVVNLADVHTDIITGCEAGFRGNGDGTFTPYTSDSFARTVVMDLGDLDTATTSIPDLATSCGDGNSAWLLAYQTGNTDGTFDPAECVPGTINPGDGTYETIDVEIERYNLANDQYSDLLYFDQGRTNLIGNEWNSDGLERRGAVRPTNGLNGVALETGDLDGDSDPDWVAAMQGPPSLLSVFEHKINGFPAEDGGGKLHNTIDGIQDLELADVNRDDILDAVTVNQTAVGVQLGNGDLTFKPRQEFPFAAGAGASHNLATGDLDGNGLTDIVATTSQTGDVSVFMSQVTDDTGPPPGTEPPGGNPPGSDTGAPNLGSSSAKAKQKLGKALKVTVASDEDADVSASAIATPKGKAKRAKKLRFKTATAQVKAGTPVRLTLKPSKKTARKLKAAAKAKAQITLSATDAAGNTATDTLKVKLG